MKRALHSAELEEKRPPTARAQPVPRASYVCGTPYGATTIAGGDGSRQPSEKELAIARYQGEHVAKITSKLKG